MPQLPARRLAVRTAADRTAGPQRRGDSWSTGRDAGRTADSARRIALSLPLRLKCCAPSSAGDGLDLGRRKTPDRVVLSIERLEHGQKLGNRQQIGDALRQVEQLETPALAAHRRVRAHDLAEPGAVDVRHAGQVQDDLLVTLVDEAVDLVLEQFIAFSQRDLALQIKDDDVANSTFL